jgi:hypothetical protein
MNRISEEVRAQGPHTVKSINTSVAFTCTKGCMVGLKIVVLEVYPSEIRRLSNDSTLRTEFL